jgi:hypothetical protein
MLPKLLTDARETSYVILSSLLTAECSTIEPANDSTTTACFCSIERESVYRPRKRNGGTRTSNIGVGNDPAFYFTLRVVVPETKDQGTERDPERCVLLQLISPVAGSPLRKLLFSL